MVHPRCAFGASASTGRHLRPGNAGSAVAAGLPPLPRHVQARLAYPEN